MTRDGTAFLPWQDAWQQALYGADGFYRRAEGPAGHFRTACHAAPRLLAGALARLASSGGCSAIVDVGAGRGELATALAADPAADALALHAVDVVPRPAGLPERVGWSCGLDTLDDSVVDGALVVAWELLDVVPGPVVEVDPDGVARLVLVEPGSGEQALGAAVGGQDAAWLARWWPLADARPGCRAEVGAPRDTLWASLVAQVAATSGGGLLLAVDYGHEKPTRPDGGSLAGFRNGRAVPAVPDGSCDVTAHVAIDAVAEAGLHAGATCSVLTDQRTALKALGVGWVPGDLAAAGTTGTAGAAALLAQLTARSQAAELLDPYGLGGFAWLVQGVRRDVGSLAG